MPDRPEVQDLPRKLPNFDWPRGGLSARDVSLRRRQIFWSAAALLILMGVFLPRGWYDALPRPSYMPREAVKGVTLLQISFILEGLAFVWLAVSRWTFVRLPEAERLTLAAVPGSDTRGIRTTYWSLAVIVAGAIVLRLLHLSSDLWGDEITPLLDYGRLAAWQVMTTYLNSGNHLLNTLLVNTSTTLLGQTEWTVRLPAVIFGIATIPAMYWVGCLALSRQGGLGAALLLAVSFQHIFFSQDARGYSAYLFFSLLSSGLLVRGLQEDRLWIWAFYVVTLFFDLASVLIGVYVLGAHMIVGAMALLLMSRKKPFPMNLLKRLVMVFGGVCLLAFQLYATMLPQAYFMARVWSAAPSGYPPFSMEFFGEILRGVFGRFGPGMLIAALPFLLIGGAGFALLLRRQWALTLALTLPEVLTAVFTSARGFVFVPRFFLLALPVAILAVVAGISWLTEIVARGLGRKMRIFSSSLAMALVIVLSLVSLASLKRYYAAPKQPFQASTEYVQAERTAGEIVLVSFLGGVGFNYYGERHGLIRGEDYFIVRSAADLDKVLSTHGGSHSLFVTTLPRLLHLAQPDLEARIESGWTPIRTFRGTLGGGDITIWKQR